MISSVRTEDVLGHGGGEDVGRVVDKKWLNIVLPAAVENQRNEHNTHTDVIMTNLDLHIRM